MGAIGVAKSAIRLAVLVTALASMGLSARAQQGEDLREAAQNPIGDLISLPFQNNTNLTRRSRTALPVADWWVGGIGFFFTTSMSSGEAP